MKLVTAICFSVLMLLSANTLSAAADVFRIEDYNSALPYWGFSWNPSSSAVSRYYPSFYTGFVARSQFPERIHIRTARGNQTRMTIILDDRTVSDYLFDLVKRYEVYKKFTTAPAGKRPLVRLEAGSDRTTPHLEMYYKIVESPEYDILGFVARAKAGQETNEAIYLKGLEVMERLNPGRVFRLNLNLNHQFNIWASDLPYVLKGKTPAAAFTKSSMDTVVAINKLVWGRINFVGSPSDQVISQLVEAANLGASQPGSAAFYESALKLFKLVTGSKYAFQVVGANGSFTSALQCADLSNCYLSYPELSAVYPTGSAEDWTSDQFGNKISLFYTPGLWQFLNYSGKDFDNIRKEPYYGFAPKMDFEGIGNGFHNPGVSFWSVSKTDKATLGIPAAHTAMGAVKRGGVSHGCLRLSTGHVWEMRQMFPVENSLATKVNFFGNDSKDFDVFDIDGDGRLEVIGVEYLISYSVAGASGLARRDGADLQISNDRKLEFYSTLYGKKNVFTFDPANGFVFQNPTVSLPSHLDFKKKSVKTRVTLQGDYPLYEQKYEQDKLQFYIPIVTDGLTGESQQPLSKRIVRLMGRIKGCAPGADKELCGEAAFDREADQIWKQAY